MPKVTVDGQEIDAAAWSIQGLIKLFGPELERRFHERNAVFAEAAE